MKEASPAEDAPIPACYQEKSNGIAVFSSVFSVFLLRRVILVRFLVLVAVVLRKLRVLYALDRGGV